MYVVVFAAKSIFAASKKESMKNLLTTLVMVLFALSLQAQAGVFLYAGPTVGFTKDKVASPDTYHYGYTAGINGRFNSDELFFLMGAEYTSIDAMGDKSINFGADDNVVFLTYKIGVGFDAWRINEKQRVRTKVQGNVMTLNKVNGGLPTDAGYKRLNDTASLGLGIGYTHKMWTLDLDYNIGLFNLYSGQKDTALSSISLLAGIKF